MMDASAAVSVILGSSPLGTPPKSPLFSTADFFCVGAQWDSKSTALPQAGQQTAQWAVC